MMFGWETLRSVEAGKPAHLKLLIHKADTGELKAFGGDTHLAVHAKQLWLRLVCMGACAMQRPRS